MSCPTAAPGGERPAPRHHVRQRGRCLACRATSPAWCAMPREVWSSCRSPFSMPKKGACDEWMQIPERDSASELAGEAVKIAMLGPPGSYRRHGEEPFRPHTACATPYIQPYSRCRRPFVAEQPPGARCAGRLLLYSGGLEQS